MPNDYVFGSYFTHEELDWIVAQLRLAGVKEPSFGAIHLITTCSVGDASKPVLDRYSGTDWYLRERARLLATGFLTTNEYRTMYLE